MTSAATSGSSANTATVLSKELSFTEKSLSFTNRDIAKIALIIVGLVSAVKLFVMAACYFVFGSSIIGSVIFTVGAALLLLSLLAIDARRKTFPPGALPSELYPTHTRDLPLHFAAKLWHLPEVTDFSSDYTSQILQPYTVSAPGISGDLDYDGNTLLVRLLNVGRGDWRHHTIFFRDCRLSKREIPNLARCIDGLILTRKNNIMCLDEQPIFVTENLSEQLLVQALASTSQLSGEEVATIAVPKELFNQLGKLIIIVNNEFNEKISPKLFKKLIQTYTAIFSIAIQNDLRSIQLPLLGMNESTKVEVERENLCLLALLHAIQLNLLVQPDLAHFRVNHLPKRILERDPKLYSRICEYLRDPQKPLPDRSFFKETPILEHVPADRTVQYYSSKSEVGMLLRQATDEFVKRQKALQEEKLRETAAKEIKDTGDRPTPTPIHQETVSAVSALLSSSTAKQISTRVKKKPDSRPMSTPTPVAPAPQTVTAPTPKAPTPQTVTTPTPKAPAPQTVTTPTPKAPAPQTVTTPTPKAPAPQTVTTPTPKAPAPQTVTAPTPKAPAPQTVTTPTPVAPTPQTVTAPTPKAPAPQTVTAPTPVAPTPQTVTAPTPVAPAPQTVTTPTPKAPAPQTVTTPTPVAPAPQTVTAPTPKAPAPQTVTTPTPVAPAPQTVTAPTPKAPAPQTVTTLTLAPAIVTQSLPTSLNDESSNLSLSTLSKHICNLLSFSGKSLCGKRILSTKTKRQVGSILSNCSQLTINKFEQLSPQELAMDLFVKDIPIHMSSNDRDEVVNDFIFNSFDSLPLLEISLHLEEVLSQRETALSDYGTKNIEIVESILSEIKRNLQLSSQSLPSISSQSSEKISASTFSLDGGRKKKGMVAKLGRALTKVGQRLSEKSGESESIPEEN
ncbi:hypothetical protein [Chlamydiifrater volucris]|uniref:hypothetical protein n=1 Tax=Chlamydiifrater volucris TaxID=2681470 RepID=UPI0032B22F9A